ncbi:MAG TPA: zinc ribbon domain-containing protein [Solirubrobacteraceae bacterium]
MSMHPIRDDDDDAPTSDLLSGTVGDRCSNCQKPLAPDQRYCVNCGTRRGKPRFSFESLSAQAAPPETPEPKPHRTRMSAATTLVAGVATLLLALGVGVLIGHNSNGTTQRAAASPQIITVGGSGAAAGTGATAGGATAALKKTGKVHKVKSVVVHLTAQTKAKAAAAANKVFGNSGGNLVKDPTVQVGGACSGGAGCQNGKFTGNFFGGG